MHTPGTPSAGTGPVAGYGGQALKSKSITVRVNINPSAVNSSLDKRPPSTKDVKYGPESIRQSTAVVLRAEIDDSDTGNSNIAAAEYFIGKRAKMERAWL
ncbi:MAG: hypothetical protein A2Z02_00725 [Chloroflexi bacterium RBG_16_48_7]|nr:MAG: hypothetical protein A2Z02_00725 [Chloroflexi bacterium RBG_16_48_7]